MITQFEYMERLDQLLRSLHSELAAIRLSAIGRVHRAQPIYKFHHIEKESVS